MKIAYADPPYPRQSRKWYGDHPDFDGEVDHADLLAQLCEGFDGWALSTGAYAIQEVLRICPPGVRVGIWNCTNTAHPGNMGAWWWSWEAVIFAPARGPEAVTRDFLSCASPRGFLGGTIAGQKPVPFAEWVFALVGARPDDDFVDVFPGSGAVGEAWTRWARQTRLDAQPSLDQLAIA